MTPRIPTALLAAATVGAALVTAIAPAHAESAARATECDGKPATIIGPTSGADTVGTDGDDVIVAPIASYGSISAGNGNDTICLVGVSTIPPAGDYCRRRKRHRPEPDDADGPQRLSDGPARQRRRPLRRGGLRHGRAASSTDRSLMSEPEAHRVRRRLGHHSHVHEWPASEGERLLEHLLVGCPDGHVQLLDQQRVTVAGQHRREPGRYCGPVREHD